MKQFSRVIILLFLSLWSNLFGVVVVVVASDDPTTPPKLITEAELSLATGVDTDKIWLSLLGRVYDVSGSPDFYGPGGPYHIFVGRDAPVPFVTGKFNDEEASKSWDTLTTAQLSGLQHWTGFFPSKYTLVGLLVGTYYDEQGQPTAEKIRVTSALVSANNKNGKSEL